MSDWKTYIFSDVAEFVSDKIDLNTIETSQYISTDNMQANLGGISVIEKLPTSKRCNSFQKNDVLFSNIRTYFRKVWLADFDGGCSADVLVMRSKDEAILLTQYLYLLVCSDDFINFTVATSKGAKMPRGDKNAILKYEFSLSEIDTQKKSIRDYLTFNNKIQLNNETNATLESIAQAIFKSWFIDFDPVHAKAHAHQQARAEGKNDSQAQHLANIQAMQVISGKKADELAHMEQTQPSDYAQLLATADAFPSAFDDKGLPLGWVIGEFSKLAELSTKSVKPQTEPETLWEHYSIPAFDVNQMPSYELGETIKSNKYVVNKNAILSSKLNPNTPRTWLPCIKGKTAVCSTEFMQFIPKNSYQRYYLYCLITSEYFQKEIQMRVTGSTGSRQRAQPKQVHKIDVVISNENVMKCFANFTDSLFDLININKAENIELAKTRDTLLPKLLRGEV